MDLAMLSTVELVRSFVGCSLTNRTDELSALVQFPADPPGQDVRIKTNCAMFVLGIWRRLGCEHPLLTGSYRIGMALSWALRIAVDARALHRPDDDEPSPGDVLHYGTPGKNNDHLEFLTTSPDGRRLAFHAGAGRPENAVTESEEPSDYMLNAGRPLQHWISTSRVIAYAGRLP